ncbi:MAG: PAS domain S-box protein [Desulfobulbaceae bacterium]|nr:PAS domain S-box protein [Desulfobulbaceae bacterium]
MENQKRFSSFLMTFIVLLVTGSVLLISTSLYLYFSKRLTTEFHNKLLAQKGQIELILQNRLAHVQRRLRDLSLDNTIRVTMMLEVVAQLEEQLQKLYPPENGMYFFVKSSENEILHPNGRTPLPQEFFDLRQYKGVSWEEGHHAGLFWVFATPVMRRTERLGWGYVVYDLTRDKEVLESIRQTTDSEIAILRPGGLYPVTDQLGEPLFSLDAETISSHSAVSGFTHLDKGHILSSLTGFGSLYFLDSLEKLTREKRNISLLIALFGILVTGFSATLAIFLGNQMSRPLKELADKAVLISVEKKDLHFERLSPYLEFNQLALAFNNMLISIADEKSRYEDLLENVDDAVYLFDGEGQIVDANEATYSRLGYSREAFFHVHIASILPAKDTELLFRQLENQNTFTVKRRIRLETKHIKADGDYFPVEINSRPILYGGKEVILNVARDLSERRQSELALRESEEKYRSILDNIEECYFEIDFSGNLVFFNRAMCQLLERPDSDLAGKHFKEFTSPESSEILAHVFELVRKSGMPQRIDYYEIITPSGEKRILQLSISLLRDVLANPSGFRGVGRDVTETLLFEEQKNILEMKLHQAQKMEAIGTLAGGVAHDFNNILSVILGFAEIVKVQIHAGSHVQDDIDQVINAAKRATGLVKQILTFSRKSEQNLEPMLPHPIIKEALKMLRSSLPSTIDIQEDIEAEYGLLQGDPTQIHQIVVNLCTNALHAMENEKGTLSVSLRRREIKAEDVKEKGAEPGDFFVLSISDTGQGMKKETIERIFDPYFTTKETGKGTGLGLAVIHGIVTGYKGFIEVESEPGVGTAFHVYLPVISEDSSQVREKEKDESLPSGSERILVVDDESAIVAMCKATLAILGYQVSGTTDSQKALEIFRRNPDQFDLIILDQTMPGLSGYDLASEILKIRSELPIILCTGFSSVISQEQALALGIKKFTFKPLHREKLAVLVRECLDKS